MKKSNFTESQIVTAIKKQEAGATVKEICRELGISEPTYYKWKAKYGGMEASELKHVKELEAELAQYKKMYAEVSYDLQAAKNLIAKKWQAWLIVEPLQLNCSPTQISSVSAGHVLLSPSLSRRSATSQSQRTTPKWSNT